MRERDSNVGASGERRGFTAAIKDSQVAMAQQRISASALATSSWWLSIRSSFGTTISGRPRESASIIEPVPACETTRSASSIREPIL